MNILRGMGTLPWERLQTESSTNCHLGKIIFSFLLYNFPTVLVSCKCSNHQFFTWYHLDEAAVQSVLSDMRQRLIPGFHLIPSHYPPALMTIGVMDYHPIAAELPADSRAGCIDCTGESFHRRVFPHEWAAFHRLTLF